MTQTPYTLMAESNPTSGTSDDETPRESTSAESASQLDLRVARRMFYGGFLGLPWLWFVVWAHYRRVSKQPHADPRLATYVARSLVGAICGGVLLLLWIAAVQLSWHSWGSFGRAIMLIIPEGDEL